MLKRILLIKLHSLMAALILFLNYSLCQDGFDNPQVDDVTFIGIRY